MATTRRQLQPDLVQRAVEAFNRRYGDLEGRLSMLAHATRMRLSHGDAIAEATELAREVNAWGKTRGSRADYPRVGRAFAAMPWRDLDKLEPLYSDARADFVVDLCEQVVRQVRDQGGRRREYSWASKCLHWLWPQQVPVNDAFVREWLGIREQGRAPYRQLVGWAFEQAEQLRDHEMDVVGDVEPRTLLRAIDKAAWWIADQERRKPSTPIPQRRVEPGLGGS